MDLVIGTRTNPAAVDNLVAELTSLNIKNSTLYVGYPILSTSDYSIALDAIYTSVEHGIIVFDLGVSPTDADWEEVVGRQDEVDIALKSKLIRHKELTKKRQLDIPIHVVTYVPGIPSVAKHSPEIIIAIHGKLAETLEELDGMDAKYVRPLNAAIQQVTTIKPVKKRLSVKLESSRGGILKVIEREVANLDRWQKKAAIECPDGPQRIRGLAGSGKTVVLALKAAYLHAQHPEWKIAVAFQTRSLYGQFKDLIRRFTFEHVGDEPNWDQLQVLHAWGSRREPGIYSTITSHYNIPCNDFSYAKSRYLSAGAFEGICGEALDELQKREVEPIYDALLLDEAQDFGPNFFKLAYSSVKPPHRFVFAYDELQTLRETSLPGLSVLFGIDDKEEPIVKLRNFDSQPQQDVILPVCYRNTPWALCMAHALGFGVYRSHGLIQMFDDPSLWSDIGYRVASGSLEAGDEVVLERKPEATPEFFSQLLDHKDAVIAKIFQDTPSQAAWVAAEIAKNLEEDELEPGDILVIFTNPLNVAQEAGPLISELRNRGIQSHIAGVNRSVDEFFVTDSVVISGIYRAKGNEAPMVYVLGAQYCNEGIGLIRRRNTLFTAMTRSRAWVRVCGIGPGMASLIGEMKEVREKNYKLSFTVPNPEELKMIRRINRDKTDDEIQKIESSRKSLEEVVEMLDREELILEDLPASLKESLLARLMKKK